MLKRKVADQRTKKIPKNLPHGQGTVAAPAAAGSSDIGITQKRTPILMKSGMSVDLSNNTTEAIQKARTGEIKPIPSNGTLPEKGYYLISRNEPEKLEELRQEIIKHGICSLDYETNGDPDDDTQDVQDHYLTMVSFAFKVGLAFCMPLAMDSYGANFDTTWFVENFMKPIMEDPEILILIHNVKAEHGWSLLYGIDMFDKACKGKVIDTMLLVKNLALPENIEPSGDGYEVRVGLKPATKALLADKDGMVHGLIHIDDIKSFTETVGKHTWEEPTGEFYKSGPKKGLPKTKKFSRSRTFNELPITQEVIDYSCSDSDWCLGLYYKLMPLVEAEGMTELLTELDVPRMMVLAEYELAGWKINPNKLIAMGRVADKALHGEYDDFGNCVNEGIEAKLQAALVDIIEKQPDLAEIGEDGQIIVPAGEYPMGTWRNSQVFLQIKETKPFKWSSTQHKQWLFFWVLGVSMVGIERSKTTGLPKTGGDIIDAIIKIYTANNNDSEFMKLLKEKIKYDKINSTYVGKYNQTTGKYTGGMLSYCREDTHKLHTVLSLVDTWRLSSKKPNLQNIPRADNDPMGIREVFEAPYYDPKKDYSSLRSPLTRPTIYINTGKLSGHTVWVGADYSQVELKVLAWYANEESMIKTLANGGDLHSVAAHEVFKLPCSVDEVKKLYKPYRYRAKKVNFGLVYGMTKYGLSADPEMAMTVDEAATFIEQYMKTYPGVRQYQHDIIAFARKHGYVETMFGHRRAIPEINNPNKWLRLKGENKAMNTPIQGSAADIIEQAMVNLRKEAPKWLKPVIQIHDELMCETPVEYAVEGCKILQSIMERDIPGFSEVMPLVADPSVGKIWRFALDIQYDEHGTPYVHPKEKRKEATDVTFDDIKPHMHLYKLAGIEVR